MAYLSFARQLAESKRRSRLTGRPDTTRYATADYQSGASDRLSTKRSIAQRNDWERQQAIFMEQLAAQRAQMAKQQDEFNAKQAALPTFSPSAPSYDDLGPQQATLSALNATNQDLADWIAYKAKYPYATRLSADDPSLNVPTAPVYNGPITASNSNAPDQPYRQPTHYYDGPGPPISDRPTDGPGVPPPTIMTANGRVTNPAYLEYINRQQGRETPAGG